MLEEGAFRRVGGLRDIPLDVRVLAASNRDLKAESEAGRFRLDLYYRLSIIQIDIPPLRDRGDDVLLLSQHYIDTIGSGLSEINESRACHRSNRRLSANTPGPATFASCANVIERALILEDNDDHY